MSAFTTKQSLKDYALNLYARRGVAELVIALQDQFDVQVNCLLSMCWLADMGHAVNGAELDGLCAVTKEYNEHIIKPLRHVRRQMRQTGKECELYNQVKATELTAELLQLEAIEAFFRPLLSSTEAAEDVAKKLRSENSRCYLQQYNGIKATEPLLQQWLTLL